MLKKEPPFQPLDLTPNQPAPPSLQNIGNTCWMNSVLQAVLSLTALNNAIVAETNSRKAFIVLMRNVINSRGVKLSEPQTLSTIGKMIQSKISALHIGNQNCADEGLIAIFDLISDSEHAITPIGTKYTSRIWCNRTAHVSILASSNPKVINYISPILIPPQMNPSTPEQFVAIIRSNESTLTAKCAVCTRDALSRRSTDDSPDTAIILRDIKLKERQCPANHPPNQHQPLTADEVNQVQRKWEAMDPYDRKIFAHGIAATLLNTTDLADHIFDLETRGIDVPYVTHSGLTLRESLSHVQETIILRFNRIQRAQGDRVAHWYPISFRIPHIRPGQPNDHFEFELCAVINHSGGDNGGHYTAYVRRGPDWYHANDSSITRMPAHPQPEPTAFLLFYHFTRFV